MNGKKLIQCFFLCIVILFLIGVIGGVVYLALKEKKTTEENPSESTQEPTPSQPTAVISISKFLSENDFHEYLSQGSKMYSIDTLNATGLTPQAATKEVQKYVSEGNAIDRYSKTNIQVEGVDEPDKVKTDGKFIYFSPDFLGLHEQLMVDVSDEKITAQEDLQTKLLKAVPYENLQEVNTINVGGELLLFDNVLIIISDKSIYAYDVTSAKTPQKIWDMQLDPASRIIDARQYGTNIYISTQNVIDTKTPCPIDPIMRGKSKVTVKCTDIYHPSKIIVPNVTYTIMRIHPKKGSIDDYVSFVGQSSQSILYMSEKSLYVTYTQTTTFFDFLYSFFKDRGSDILPATIMTKIENLKGYDISEASKMYELGIMFEEFQSSLTEERKNEIYTELEKRISEYASQHSRELESTGILRITPEHLEVAANGNVPGILLNQFSLDEYNDHLRVATTIGNYFGIGSEMTINDVYTLSSSLEKTGEIKDLGAGEQIYSVRFLQDMGYVVTFQKTDPFYVLDLSDPVHPEMKGELKIPGYSSYLHQIAENEILGVGKEDENVKLSLYDVTDPQNPSEVDTYELNENWTTVFETHHGFLQDDTHNIFFIPAGNNGYIFSYTNDQIKLIKTIEKVKPIRAVFIEDYFYVIGRNTIVVFSEKNWKQVKTLSLS